jgi:dTDP-4-amino-4,6-dideoxygalactose transaminase
VSGFGTHTYDASAKYEWILKQVQRNGACASGTAALYLALYGLKIGKGDSIAIPAYACSALLNAVFMSGATPNIVDVRSDDFTIDPGLVDIQAPDATAAIAVHCFGARADIEGLQSKTDRIVEDCCQSLGGYWHGKPVGGSGNVAVFSFYATKIITCGHGGLLWDPKGVLGKWARDYREFDCRKRYKPRFNFHLSDIQAAMARNQFDRIESIRHRRKMIMKRYLAVLPHGLGHQAGLASDGSMVYRFVILFEKESARDAAKAHFEANDIETRVPIERYELLHRYMKLDPHEFPVSEGLVDTTLSLPLYPMLTDTEVDKISGVLGSL